MGSPSTSIATLRPDLASFEQFNLAMDREGFIGHRVLTVIDVAKQSGSFGRIKLADLLQNRETERAPGAGYSRGSWKFDKQAFACDEHGAEEPVDDVESKMYAEYFDAEQVCTQRAFDVVLRNAERRIAAAVFNTGTWTGGALTTAVAGGKEWSVAADALPITDIKAAKKKVWDGCGLWPNALVLNRHVFNNLRECAQIIERVKYSGFQDPVASKISAAALAQVFDLEFILIAGSAKNSANEGQAAALASIWDDEKAMVCRIGTTNDFREPCIGRVLHWNGDGSEIDGRVETYRDESIRGDVVRVRHQVDELILYPQCGHLITNVS